MNKPIVVGTVGFIGVRGGLAYPQFRTASRLLVECDGPNALTGVEEVHRANDGWGDADFDRIFRWMTPTPRVVIHEMPKPGQPVADPPISPAHNRNRQIVDSCNLLVACPPVEVEELRSRTWVAVRYARRVGKMVIIILPDGTMEVGGREYYMTPVSNGRQSVSVFLCHDPRPSGYGGLRVTPVLLETLPHSNRLGPDGTATARPLLGRSTQGPLRYREFPSRKALLRAGFVPAGRYRVCDTWDDYHNPWLAQNEGSILDTGAGQSLGSTDPNGAVEAILRDSADADAVAGLGR